MFEAETIYKYVDNIKKVLWCTVFYNIRLDLSPQRYLGLGSKLSGPR